MRRPGANLRAIAARFCSARTLERLVDPAVADLQAEHEDAVARGRRWHSRWVWLASHVGFFKALGVHAGERFVRAVGDTTDAEHRALARAFGVCIAVVIVGTLVLAGIPFLAFVSWGDPNSPSLAMYLVPQALPLAIPAGIACGVLWGLGRVDASRRLRALVLLAAIAASVASLGLLAWIVPASNQAFRASIMGPSVLRGLNELTLLELGQLLEPGTHEPMALAAPVDTLNLALAYHQRWALACAPAVLSLFSIALASKGRRRTWTLGVYGCAAVVGYFVFWFVASSLGRDRALPVVAAAWVPNAVFAIGSVAVTRLRWPMGGDLR